jgi:D-methionine transport system substrate-binding protein
MRIKTLWVSLLGLCVSICLTACTKEGHSIKVGTIAGPETELMEVAQTVAKQRYNLDVQIVSFADYNLPNAALAEGSIDANAFQHRPYLDQSMRTHGYRLVSIGKTFIYPMGLYSTKIKDLNSLPEKARVAIPNDPSNGGRALLLLQKAGIIKLNNNSNDTNYNITRNDIIENPKNIELVELDAAQLPRTLNDVDLAAINTNYALLAKLTPSQDALLLENGDSPYANLIVARDGDATRRELQQLVKAFQSHEVLARAGQLFNGQAAPAW